MTPGTIDKLLSDLRREEGFVPHAYKDSRGFLTIGFGRLVDERLGGGITEDEAEYLLAGDVARVATELERAMPWFAGQPQDIQRALADMCFQLGLPKLLGFRKMLAALQRGDRAEAAQEALESDWARQCPERAGRVSALLRGAGGA